MLYKFSICFLLSSISMNTSILQSFFRFQGNLLLALKRPEAAVIAFRGAQELRPDLRSYQGEICKDKLETKTSIMSCMTSMLCL